MMEQPWNLEPEAWAKVLSKDTNPAKLAQDIRRGKNLPWVETLVNESGDAQSVLDLGSGCGQNSAALALLKKNTTLLDWSVENITFSKSLFKELNLSGTFMQGDMTKRLPFDDGSFDLVFSCGVLEYFSDEQLHQILKDMLRVARRRVIIMVPNARSIAYQTGMWYMKKTKQWEWGGERPFPTMRPYFDPNQISKVTEYTVSTWHALNFLTMPAGRTIQKIIRKLGRITEHSRPAGWHQGYLLISIAEKQS
jgi:ubiquinone/menaquinone biosynthesis C-methylase UbiE